MVKFIAAICAVYFKSRENTFHICYLCLFIEIYTQICHTPLPLITVTRQHHISMEKPLLHRLLFKQTQNLCDISDLTCLKHITRYIAKHQFAFWRTFHESMRVIFYCFIWTESLCSRDAPHRLLKIYMHTSAS